MTPSSFCFTRNNHFLCTERTGLIRKVYLVFITKGYIIGVVVNKGMRLNTTKGFENTTIVGNNLILSNSKPYDCITEEYWNKIKDVYLFDENLYKANKHNFRIEISEITAFDYMITGDTSNKSTLHGLFYLSTYITDLKVNKPQTQLLYNASAKYAKPNTSSIRKKLDIIEKQAANFDATYTVVRNWLIEQNIIG